MPLLSPKPAQDLTPDRAMLFNLLAYTWLGCNKRETTNMLIFRAGRPGRLNQAIPGLGSQMHKSKPCKVTGPNACQTEHLAHATLRLTDCHAFVNSKTLPQ